jgi:hypothetical protein
MRFTLLFPVALLAGFAAAAGPIRDTDITVTAAGGSGGAPEYEAVEAPSGPSADAATAPEVVGEGGDTVSKRGEFNPLEDRAAPILILCPDENCRGRCWGYNLNFFRFNVCYETRKFHSVFISSKRGLGYGLFVADESRGRCRGTSSRMPCVLHPS